MAIDRADQIRASTTMTGIDFIEVSPNQTELTLFLQHDVLPVGLVAALAAISPADVHIIGEGQVDPPMVTATQNVSPLPPPVNGRAVMRLVLAEPGGFGFYRLQINNAAIDPYFNNVRFTFKAACDSDLDCKVEGLDCPAPESADFPVDYRARDFWSFRQALIDFAAQRYPDWRTVSRLMSA